MRGRAICWSVAVLLGLLPALSLAQVFPGGGGAGIPTFPVTTCVNAVGTGITSEGVLTCATVTPAMTTGLVPSGADVTATGQVTQTHLALPLPLTQGGLGITSGNPGGLLYFPTPTTVGSSLMLALNEPVFGGGPGAAPVTGTRSGTTLEVATVFGPHTQGKQLGFDANGNVVASGADIGGSGTGGAVSSVFGRIGAVIAQSGDYNADQITNAAHLLNANMFAHPSGQTMARLNLLGTVTGTLSLRAPPFAGASLLTLPAGTLDMTTTGGPGQVVKQTSVAGPLSVGQLSFTDLLGTTSVCTTDAVCTGYQPLLTFTPENVTNKSPLTSLGTSNVLYPTQGAVKSYVDTGLATRQAALGFTPENVALKSIDPALGTSDTLYPTQNAVKTYVDTGLALREVTANKSSVTTLGTSNVLYPTQGAVKSYVDTGLALKQDTLGFAAENSANKSPVTTLGTSNTLYPTQNAVKVYADTGLALKENSANKSITTALGTSDILFPTQNAVKVYVDTGLALKQNTLGFTPEDVARKDAGALTASTITYPTSGAVKTYVDVGVASRQAILTWGPGLAITGDTARTASTETDFLTSGGGTSLTCGAGQQGKMQVMLNGDLQYCDGATTSLLQSGRLTQAGLTWNVTTSSCTGDTNGGKLTVVGTTIQCASDIGGSPPAGAVSSVFGRTGVVVSQSGDYTASQVTNAADLTAANVFTHATGNTMVQLRLPGATSGMLTLKAAATSGSSVLTFPQGTTDFSATGGTGQVVRQSSVGGPLTVATLAFADLTGTSAVCTTASVCSGYQPTLTFTPETITNKSTVTTLGTSDAFYPSQNAVKVYVDTGLALKENSANKSITTTLGTSDTLFPTQNAVKVYVDTGLALKQNTLAFTPEDVARKDNGALTTSATTYPTSGAVKSYVDTGLALKENSANKSTTTTLGTSDTLFPTQNAVKIYVDTGLALKQNTLAFTPENIANKSVTTTLGTSDILYPTQNAVKAYVDTAGALKQNTLSWGAGLDITGTTARTASTEADFLTDGGATNLTCGPSNQGKMQVMDSGELQYCGGEPTPAMHTGVPTQSGLTWNVVASTCTSDPNLGKLTISGTQIICSADLGGGAGSGNVLNTGAPLDNQLAVWTNTTTIEGTPALTYASGVLQVGVAGTLGKLALAGNTSGLVTIQPQAAAGTYNFNLPITAGTAGQVLRSQGGVGTAMDWLTLAASATTDTTNAANITSGIYTTAGIVHPSTSTGSTYYNTVDQTTNFERVTLAWSGNNFDVLGSKGGTGVNRIIRVVDSNGFGFSTLGTGSGSLRLIGASAGASSLGVTAANTGLALQGNLTNGALTAVAASNVSNLSPTTGSQIGLGATFTFAPTTGTATFAALQVSPTINQTGGSNGITRGLYITPTITAAADFRALEVASGSTVLNGALTTTGTTTLNGPLTVTGTLTASSPAAINLASSTNVPLAQGTGTLPTLTSLPAAARASIALTFAKLGGS